MLWLDEAFVTANIPIILKQSLFNFFQIYFFSTRKE